MTPTSPLPGGVAELDVRVRRGADGRLGLDVSKYNLVVKLDPASHTARARSLLVGDEANPPPITHTAACAIASARTISRFTPHR